MGKKKSDDIGFKRSMLRCLNKGSVTVIVGWFPIDDDISNGVCFLDIDLDESGNEQVNIDYNFGEKKLVLKP